MGELYEVDLSNTSGALYLEDTTGKGEGIYRLVDAPHDKRNTTRGLMSQIDRKSEK
jgi:hypothetical protein